MGGTCSRNQPDENEDEGWIETDAEATDDQVGNEETNEWFATIIPDYKAENEKLRSELESAEHKNDEIGAENEKKTKPRLLIDRQDKKIDMLSSRQKAKEQKEVSKEVREELKALATEFTAFLPPMPINEEKSADIPEKKKPKVNLLSSALKAAGMNFQVVAKGEPSNLKDLCNLNAAGCPILEVKFPDTGGSTWYDGQYGSIAKPSEMNKFKTNFQAMVAEALGCYPCEVIILRVSSSSVIVDYTVFSDKLNTLNKKGIDALKASNFKVEETIKKYTGVRVNTSVKEPCYKISPDDFDKRGDIHFPNPNGSEQMRGGRKYYQPSNKFKRIGLKVLDFYSGPKEWLNMNGHKDEWAVAYHGIGGEVPHVVSKVMKEKLRPGPRQAYKSSKSVDGKLVGAGVYCSPKLEIAIRYANTNALGTGVIVQCRVRPSAIKDCGNNYWVINDPKDIRPYGLIVSADYK